MLGEVAEPLFGGDARLKLGKQRGDRLERVDLLLLPPAGAELHEAEHAGARVAGHQRRGRHRRRRRRLARPQRAADPPGGPIRTGHHRLAVALTLGEHRLDAVQLQRRHQIRIRAVGSSRPFGDQRRRRGIVVVVAQEAGVHIELLDEPREYLSLTEVAVGAVASISAVATEVTTRFRLRGTESSDTGHYPVWVPKSKYVRERYHARPRPSGVTKSSQPTKQRRGRTMSLAVCRGRVARDVKRGNRVQP